MVSVAESNPDMELLTQQTMSCVCAHVCVCVCVCMQFVLLFLSGWLLDWSGPCQVGCLTGQVRVELVA